MDKPMECFTLVIAIATVLYVISSFLTWKAIKKQGEVISSQLEEMRRSNTSQTFMTITNYLQQDSRVSARKRLLENDRIYHDGWTESEKNDAHTVCSTYDTIGILLKRGVIDHKMVTENWKDSIIKCYEKTLPYLMKLKKRNRLDSWEGFAWLYERAMEEKEQ